MIYDAKVEADKCYEKAASAETHTEAIANISDILLEARAAAFEEACRAVCPTCVADYPEEKPYLNKKPESYGFGEWMHAESRLCDASNIRDLAAKECP